MKIIPFLALALLFSPSLVYAQKAQDASADLWAERRLMALPEGCPEVLDFSVSQNLEHVVCLVGTVLEKEVVFDGKRYPSSKLFYPPQWESAWNFVAWSTADIVEDDVQNGRLFVNGEVVVKQNWIGPARTDATGEVVAYWLGENAHQENGGPVVVDKAQLVVGKKTICELESGFPMAFELSVNGKVPAYSFTQLLRRKNRPLPLQQSVVYLGKKEIGQALFIPKVSVDARGRTIAYQHGLGGQENTFVFLRNKAVDSELSLQALPVLDPQGQDLAYLAKDETGVAVVKDGKTWKGRWSVVGPPVWDDKGRKLAVIVNRGMDPLVNSLSGFGAAWFANQQASIFDKENQGYRTLDAKGDFFLLVDGEQVGKTYTMAKDPVWGPAGKQVAFRAKDDLGWRIVVGEQESDVYPFVTAPRFSQNGTRIGFGALVGTEIYWRTMSLDNTAEPSQKP